MDSTMPLAEGPIAGHEDRALRQAGVQLHLGRVLVRQAQSEHEGAACAASGPRTEPTWARPPPE
jgi:hypothetical protein